MLEFKESRNNPETKEINQDFFEEAFRQTKGDPLRYGKMTGKFFNRFLAIKEEHESKLKEIDPSLSANLLFQRPLFDPDKEAPLPFIKWRKINEIISSNTKALEQTVVHVLPDLLPQHLPHGTLKIPPVYYQQRQGRTCYLTSYAMVFTALTGHAVQESTILHAAAKNDLLVRNSVLGVQPVDHTELPLFASSNLDVPEENLLGVFRTPAFRERFGEAGVIKFSGGDFTDIANLTQSLQEKASQRGKTITPYFIAFHKSEVVSNGTHTPILLAADQNWVQLHDPSKIVGGAHKLVSKTKFISLWAKSNLRGDYIFALKPKI